MTATDYHIWWQRYFVVQLADDGTRRMTTRSGQPYKKEGMAAEQFEKMFQFLLEDRMLRDQEFAAERDRLENERRTRERVLPPGRKESCRRGGKSPAAGEERVLPPGRKESCRRGGKSPAAGEERVLPPGRKESCRRGGESLAPGRERARAALQEGKSEGVCDARRSVRQRVYVQKSRRAKKRQKQEIAWSEDSGKELIFDLVGRGLAKWGFR